MSWWGKLIGGTFGFMMGGPLGALLGASLGNYFDRGIDGVGRLEPGDTERVQSAFFTTTFTLMGYIAKSDGRVSRDEVAMAEQVIRQMNLNARQRQAAINLFNEGKQEGFPLHEVLAQFRRESHRRRNLVQMLLEIVVATAFADGRLHLKEQGILEEIAGGLGFSQAELNAVLARLTGQAHFLQQDSTRDKLAAAYELLGVGPDCNDAELKQAYRRQMNQHHPDKLVARGMPEEMIDIATGKTRDIKSAWELIKSERARASGRRQSGI